MHITEYDQVTKRVNAADKEKWEIMDKLGIICTVNANMEII